MPTTKIKLILPPSLSTRKEIRNFLIKKFLEEEPGTGKGEKCSKYIYYVEELQTGNRVFLKRPAPLNKGVDFEVHVESVEFRAKGPRRTMPSHDNIISDLTIKRQESPKAYEHVRKIINSTFACKHVDGAYYQRISTSFSHGHSIEAILKAIKWLFIEQDVTYWNWSGRNMLMNSLENKDLC